jgi:hypothetical protein
VLADAEMQVLPAWTVGLEISGAIEFEGGLAMKQVATIGLDLAKTVFQSLPPRRRGCMGLMYWGR